MREPPIPCPPLSFDEPTAEVARRRALPVTPVHVKVEVRVDPAHPVVTGVVTHTVRALRSGTTTLTLDAADLRVRGATQGGAALAFAPHAAGVDVTLAAPLAAGEAATFSVAFEAHPTAGLYFTGRGEDGQAWTQGAMEDHHHWFPCFDAPQHIVTTEVVVEVPAGYVGLSNGEPLLWDAPSDDPAWRRFHWRHDTPHALYLLTLVVDRVVPVTDDRGPVPLVHYAPPGREADVAVLFERVPEMLRFFGEATGRPYPYGRYGHVFLREFMWGGMENTTLTSLTDQVLVEGRHRGEEDVERLFAHELAHQWFGDLIAPRGWPEIWLNESFASYFEILCMGALDGPDEFARRLQVERDAYLQEARGRYARPVVTRRYAHPYVLFDKHAYEKGALVLHTLRDQLGDEVFWRGLRDYVARCAGRAAETADFRRALEEHSGEDLSDFFEHLVYGPSHPQVGVRWVHAPRTGLEVTLARLDPNPQSLDVAVAVAVGGAVRRHRVRLQPGTRTLVLPEAAAPVWVAVDPDQACLLEVDERYEEDAALRARLDPAHAEALLRMRTARVLGGRGSAQNTRRLDLALATDPSVATRVEVARALGEHRADLARAALVSAARTDGAWRVRAAAGRALGVGADDRLLPELDALLRAEPAHRVRAGLLGALGDIRTEASRALIVRELDTPSPRAAISAAAVAALAAHEDPGTLDELLRRTHAGQARPVRQAAVAGLGRLAKAHRGDKAVGRRAREALEGLLFDPGFHVRAAAIDALRTAGDPEARGPLERAHGAEAFALLRRLMREALGALTQ